MKTISLHVGPIEMRLFTRVHELQFALEFANWSSVQCSESTSILHLYIVYRPPSTLVTTTSVENVDFSDTLTYEQVDVLEGEGWPGRLPLPIEVEDDDGGYVRM